MRWVEEKTNTTTISPRARLQRTTMAEAPEEASDPVVSRCLFFPRFSRPATMKTTTTTTKRTTAANVWWRKDNAAVSV